MASTNSASASQAFRNIALRLKGEEVPFIDLTVKLSLVDRIRSWVAGRPI
jgi:septum formation inhibitor-activating ATPase MinD